MEDILKEMRQKINKDLIFVERAENLKKIANISSKKAVDYLTSIEELLPSKMSGYSCGEMWYVRYKGHVLFSYDKTKGYEGRGAKYNKYARYGRIVISLDTQVALQKFIDYITKGKNIFSSYLYNNWVDKENSIYKKWKQREREN